MTKPKKKPALVVKASVWLRDEQIFTVLKDLDHTPRPGEEFVIDGELWQIVEWMDRIECERVANEADPDHWTTITSSFQVRPNRH